LNFYLNKIQCRLLNLSIQGIFERCIDESVDLIAFLFDIEAKELGYTMKVGIEAEFFLFERDEKGAPTTITNDVAGYFSLDPEDMATNCLREIIERLELMGFVIEASHHEVAEGQHEINFKYADAPKMKYRCCVFGNSSWIIPTVFPISLPHFRKRRKSV
jgi:hypothetical protein